MLLVEDEDLVRDPVRRFLGACGFLVLAAATGPEALEIAAGHPGPIDVLVADVTLPGMSGPELAVRLAELRPGLRVLYVSGDGPRLHQLHAAVLPKPYAPTQLIAALDGLLR